jgi:hypothetical protein
MITTSIFSKVLSSSERKRMKHLGIKKILKPSLHFTNLERKYYLMLKELNVFYIPQYPLSGRFFDAFLPDENILLEFDGSFWHPLTEEACKYDFQKKSMKVDVIKNDMAKKNGIRIIRIREEEPITREQLKKLIWD